MTMLDKALHVRDLLNDGHGIEFALKSVDIDIEDVYGEDLGSEFLEVDDPENDIIDLSWEDGVHYRVRHMPADYDRSRPWVVEEMRRYEPDNITHEN
jgi:hypothetical protein